MSTACPSHAWDAHVTEEDRAIASRVEWWKQNRDRVLQVACAIIASGTVPVLESAAHEFPTWPSSEIVDAAESIVLEIEQRGTDPYSEC